MLVQNSPLVAQSHFLNAASAEQSQKLLKRIVKTTSQPKLNNKPLTLYFSEQELNGLSGLSHRAFPKLSSHSNIHANVLTLGFTYEAALPIKRRYINLYFKILPSVGILALHDIHIGNSAVSKYWLLRGITWGINTWIKPMLGDKLIQAIQAVHIGNNRVAFSVKLPTELTNTQADKYSLFKEIRDKLSLMGDVNKVRHYYQKIVQFSEQLHIDTSLSRYIAFIFTQAKQQTLIHDNSSAVIENRAALTALTLFFGPEKFTLLVGDMALLTSQEKSRKRLLQATTTLHNRVDLQKHYIYSIVLQLLGDQEASDAIGEMKEFLDSNKGGSGFSFADLLADRAGTRLAFAATSSEKKARHIQQLVSASWYEKEMMPAILDLPENINKVDFEKTYKDINSTAYKALLNNVDKRLYQLEIYQ